MRRNDPNNAPRPAGDQEGAGASADPYSRESYLGRAGRHAHGRHHEARPARQAGSWSQYSRENAAARYAAQGQSRPSALGGAATPRRRRKGLHVAIAVILAVIVAGGGLALAYFSNISGRLNAGVDAALRGVLTNTKAGDPFYMLLLGTDKSKERAQDPNYGNDAGAYRSDTMILARIDPKQKHVTLVSIERDTLVDMGENGKQKINASYSIGGAAYAVEVISKFAGVPISHYAEINFDDFTSVVDKIGGIDVNIPIDLEDPMAGLSLKAGQQTIDGTQALALCRARHAYDAYGGGDYYRTSNQRMVLGAILKKVLHSDPATIARSVNSMADSVTTDLSVTDILGLATQFQGFDLENDLMSGLEPTNAKYVNGTWYEICDTEAWKTMMQRVDQGLSPYASEDEDFTKGLAGSGSAIKNGDGQAAQDPLGSEKTYSGTVQVLNGAGVTGLAGRVAQTLGNVGFTATADRASSFDHTKTEIVYVGSENKGKADAVAETLGLSNVAADTGAYAGTADVVVVLGSDMAEN